LKVIILISERGIKIAIVLRLDVKYFVYFVWTIFKFYFKSSLILEKIIIRVLLRLVKFNK
jgi:hypothetical protein